MRSVEEWVGRDEDQKIPERVRQRVRKRAKDCCEECRARIRFGGEIDHRVALCNWNPTPQAPHGNRESNLQLLCAAHHKIKTGRDVAEKSATAKTQRAMGPLRRDEPKMKFSKRFDGTVTKWNPATKRYEPLST
jgi:5-methylcytosine-specific restriction protein A